MLRHTVCRPRGELDQTSNDSIFYRCGKEHYPVPFYPDNEYIPSPMRFPLLSSEHPYSLAQREYRLKLRIVQCMIRKHSAITIIGDPMMTEPNDKGEMIIYLPYAPCSLCKELS